MREARVSVSRKGSKPFSLLGLINMLKGIGLDPIN